MKHPFRPDGTLPFADASASNAPQRYYRAASP